jgi:hypothetical protein
MDRKILEMQSRIENMSKLSQSKLISLSSLDNKKEDKKNRMERTSEIVKEVLASSAVLRQNTTQEKIVKQKSKVSKHIIRDHKKSSKVLSDDDDSDDDDDGNDDEADRKLLEEKKKVLQSRNVAVNNLIQKQDFKSASVAANDQLVNHVHESLHKNSNSSGTMSSVTVMKGATSEYYSVNHMDSGNQSVSYSRPVRLSKSLSSSNVTDLEAVNKKVNTSSESLLKDDPDHVELFTRAHILTSVRRL